MRSQTSKALVGDGEKVFESDRIAQQAVAYNLAVLGEAARSLTPELRERHIDVPWRDVIAQRNVGDPLGYAAKASLGPGIGRGGGHRDRRPAAGESRHRDTELPLRPERPGDPADSAALRTAVRSAQSGYSSFRQARGSSDGPFAGHTV